MIKNKLRFVNNIKGDKKKTIVKTGRIRPSKIKEKNAVKKTDKG